MANAASERQVRAAAKREKDNQERFLAGLKHVLTTPQGRACMWGILAEAGVYRSVWADHGSRMAFNVGQQDFGHWMVAQLLEADETLFQIMEREGRMFQRGEDKQTDEALAAEAKDMNE